MSLINIIGWSIFGILAFFNICYSAYKHGQSKGNYNYWVVLIGTIIELGIILLIVWR